MSSAHKENRNEVKTPSWSHKNNFLKQMKSKFLFIISLDNF